MSLADTIVQGWAMSNSKEGIHMSQVTEKTASGVKQTSPEGATHQEHDEMFEVKVQDKVIGAFRRDHIQELMKAGKIDKEAKVKNVLDKDLWIAIFEHPALQRRKLQALPSVTVEEAGVKFHIILEGQKMGPYTYHELTEKIKHHQVLFTDKISTDEGVTWTKICDVEQFDRRLMKSSEKLPGNPIPKLPSTTIQPRDDGVSVQLLELAQLGNISVKERTQTQGAKESPGHVTSAVEMKAAPGAQTSGKTASNAPERGSHIKYLNQAITLLIFGGILYYFTGTSNAPKDAKETSAVQSKAPEQAKNVPKPVTTQASMDQKNKAPKKQDACGTKNPKPSGNQSFKKSQVYKNGTNGNAANTSASPMPAPELPTLDMPSQENNDMQGGEPGVFDGETSY